jgi:hypothetical protein
MAVVMSLFVPNVKKKLGQEARQALGLFPIRQELGGSGGSGRNSDQPISRRLDTPINRP